MNVNGEVSLKGSNAKKAETTIDSRLRIAAPPLSPFPPTVNPTITPILNINARVPKWMDKNGIIYGTQTWSSVNSILKSSDYWNSWTVVGTINVSETMNGLVVTDSGRIVVACDSGAVYVSDTAQTTFTLAFTFTKGTVDMKFGHCVYENIVLLSTYGNGAARGANQVYLSMDSGATWNNILSINYFNPANAHVHDVEYDPYANRIWVTCGDNENTNTYWSDDFGATWGQLYPDNRHDIGKQQFTQIIAFPHGVVFGTDQYPDGIRYWERPRNKFRPAVDEKDIVTLKQLDENTTLLRYFATRRWHVRDKNLQVCLLPWIRSNLDGPGGTILQATVDGIHWYEICHLPSGGNTSGDTSEGFRNVIGPFPGDPQRRIIGFLNKAGSTYLFQANLPEWL